MTVHSRFFLCIALSSFHTKISAKQHGREEVNKTSCSLTSVYQMWKHPYTEGQGLAERAPVSAKGLENTPDSFYNSTKENRS